jgi:NTP pyrophosphatase (non-canonical NTP hydrolase)
MYHLTFEELRKANLAKLPLFKNSKGDIAHPTGDINDWTPSQWLQAVVGELGEYANFRKKFERGDIDVFEFTKNAAKELADTQIYLDLLAARLNIDLGGATIMKYNEVSRRIGHPELRIGDDDA